jgi:RNA polymerase II-associated factor 1
MPPTIQRPVSKSPGGARGRPPGASGSSSSAQAAAGAQERKSELVCRVRYGNTLPDIPFDPKFIAYPFEPSRFIQYAPTSLERNYKYELLTEHDLGVHVDLILPEAYEKPEEIFDENTGKNIKVILLDYFTRQIM